MYFVMMESRINIFPGWTLNAEAAWKNRRPSDNIVAFSVSWNNVPTSTVESSSCAGGVGMINLAVFSEHPNCHFPGQRDLLKTTIRTME